MSTRNEQGAVNIKLKKLLISLELRNAVGLKLAGS